MVYRGRLFHYGYPYRWSRFGYYNYPYLYPYYYQYPSFVPEIVIKDDDAKQVQAATNPPAPAPAVVAPPQQQFIMGLTSQEIFMYAIIIVLLYTVLRHYR